VNISSTAGVCVRKCREQPFVNILQVLADPVRRVGEDVLLEVVDSELRKGERDMGYWWVGYDAPQRSAMTIQFIAYRVSTSGTSVSPSCLNDDAASAR
jgi:hypothetical protein